MPLDFQIEIETLKGYLKSTIAKNIPVITDPVTIDPAQGPAYITGFDFENAILTPSLEDPGRLTNLLDYLGSTPHVTVGPTQLMVVKRRPQFLLEVSVSYSTVTQLREANFNEPATQSFPLPVSFVLDAWADFDGSLSIAPELQTIPGLPPAQQQKLQDAVNALQIPIDLSSALGTGGLVQMPRFLNAGMTLSQDESFVALRFEYERPNPQTWNNFFQGQMQNVLEDRQWAALIPSDLLTGPVQQLLSDDLHNNQNLTDVAEPAIWWEPLPIFGALSIPVLGGSLSARYKDACPGVDLGFTVDLSATLSVPDINKLRLTFNLDLHTNLGDDVLCALEGAFGLPVIWPWLAANFGNAGWGVYWGGLAVGPALSFFGVLGALNSSMPLKFLDLSKELPKQFTKVSDTEYTAVYDLSSIADVLGGMALTAVGATDNALVLGGTFTVAEVTQGRLSTALDHGFDWTDQNPCGAPSYETDAVVNFGTPPPGHTIPAKFAGAFVQEDPDNQYSPHVQTAYPQPWHGGFIKVAFQDQDVNPAFQAAPYPCQLLLLSTVGARWMTIPPPPATPQIEPGSQAAIAREIWQATHCVQLGSVWGSGVGNDFNPTWNVDPPIEGLDYVRHWGIAISGLQPNDQVSAVKGESLLALSTANRAGRLQLTFFDTGAATAVALKLGADEPRSNAALQMQQTLLVRIAEIPVGGRFRTLQFESRADALMLNVESQHGVVSYQIRGKGIPTPARSIATRAPASQIAEFGNYVARHEAEAGVVQLYQRVGTNTYLSGTAVTSPEA
ncbi:hypothetical protein [Mycobacterium sp.]|uniref:hypothetical protein n=1 Tax=Mycobacterium sp. TaxID=1785 RepID=UPI003F954D0A